MKVVSLRVQNYQRVRAVEIHPEGNVVRITGRNGQGKSSVLDAMWAAIGGKAHIAADPIHDGAKEAFIEVDLGDIIVTRMIRQLDGGDTLPMLVVKSKDGNKFSDGQTALNKLVGALTFDPLQFTRKKPAEQLLMLRGLVPDFDFEANEAVRVEAYEARTDVNREAKRLRALADGVATDDAASVERVSEEDLVSQLEAAVEGNGNIDREASERARLAEQVKGMNDRAKTSRARAEQLREEAAQLEGTAHSLEKDAERTVADITSRGDLPAKADVTDIREKINAARDRNRAVDEELRRREERARLDAEAKAKEAESERLTKIIDDAKAAQEAAVKAAKMPVEGLGFGEDCVLLNGHPFEQASTSQKIRTSVAIASALNPKLRVIQVRDGSLLDSDAKKLIAEFAEQNDMQFWIEEVDETGENGFVIEDGMLKADPVPAAAE